MSTQAEAMLTGTKYMEMLLDTGHTVLIQDGGLATKGRKRTRTAVGTVLGDLATLNTDGRAIDVVRIDD